MYVPRTTYRERIPASAGVILVMAKRLSLSRLRLGLIPRTPYTMCIVFRF